MNNFPAMTEEQRQELIEDLQEVIKVEIHSVYGYAARIALAALTAEPVAVVAKGEPTLLWEWTKAGKNTDTPDGMKLYIDPPAPVLRVQDGWKLVPIEPTEDMLAAAKEWFGLTTTAEGVYEKMLAAAPEASNEQ